MIRIITAIVLGIAAVLAVYFLPAYAFDWIVFAAIIGSLIEYSRMMFSDKYERWATVLAGAVTAAAAVFLFPEDTAVFPIMVFMMFALSCFFMWRTQQLPQVAERLGLSVMPLLYLVLGLGLWSWLRHMPLGREWVLLSIVPSCLCDTFAFLFGKAIGRHKLAPQTSPNKTVEGFFGALAGSLIGTFTVYALLLSYIPWVHALIISIFIWILSPMGDLIESMMKRSAGVKDSGSIIPGHGGILDRLDALTFTGPFVYVYVKYVLQI